MGTLGKNKKLKKKSFTSQQHNQMQVVPKANGNNISRNRAWKPHPTEETTGHNFQLLISEINDRFQSYRPKYNFPA